jgi:uncharacterized protein
MRDWIQRILQSMVVLILGLIIFVLFSHVRPILGKSADLTLRICFVSVLLLSALLASKSNRLKKYWEVLFAFFISASVISVDYYLPSSKWLLSMLNIPIQTPAGIAIDKLDSSIIIIGLIVLLTKISGNSLDSIYINRRNLRRGLSIGLIAFVIVASGSVFIANIYGA